MTRGRFVAVSTCRAMLSALLLAGIAVLGCSRWPLLSPKPISARDRDPPPAERRPADVEKLAASALEDPRIQTRLAAIATLGSAEGPRAKSTLETLLDDRGELIRAAAVRALAQRGDERVLVRVQKDKSWRVRLAVAEALAGHPDATGTRLARRLVGDPSAEVEVAVVRSAGRWPLAQGGPILLTAMASSARTTRLAAAKEIAAEWPAAVQFPIDGRPAQRAAVLNRLQTEFGARFPYDPESLLSRSTPASPQRHVKGEELAEANRCLWELASSRASTSAKQQAERRLMAYGPRLVDVLELASAQSRSPLPETVFQDLLPKCAPEFVALARLRSADLTTRRRAAGELSTLAQREPLRRLALERLAAVAAKEPDVLVWRSVMDAIAHDSSEPSIRLAYAGTRHPVPEVRRMVCTYLAEHPSPEHASVLLPLLGDSHPEVVRAAIRAVGAGGQLEDRQPLRRMLGTADPMLRVDVAAALARLGDPEGPPALERLAHNSDPTVRRQAARAMGQVPNPAYKATLVGLLEDQYSVRLAAIESLSKIAPSDTPATQDLQQGTLDERIGRWKRKAAH